MPSTGRTPKQLLPSSSGVRIAKLKRISFSEDDDDDSDVSSAASNDHRFPGKNLSVTSASQRALDSVRPRPQFSKPTSRSGSVSSTSLTLSLSGDDADVKIRGSGGAVAVPGVRRKSKNCNSSSSSSSTSSRAVPAQPALRRLSSNTSCGVEVKNASTTAATTPKKSVTPAASPVAPPPLSRHVAPSQREVHQQPAPALTPAPAPPSSAANFLRPIKFLSLKGDNPDPPSTGLPPPRAVPTAVRTFTAEPSTDSPPPPTAAAAPPPQAQAKAVGAAVQRPSEAAQPTQDCCQRQKYNRICTDPSAHVTALSRDPLRLAGRAVSCHHLADPADVVLRTVDQETAAPLTMSPTTSSTAATSPASPASLTTSSGVTDRTSRVAVPTRRLHRMPSLADQHPHSRWCSTPDKVSSSSRATSPTKRTGPVVAEEEEEEAAAGRDSTYAPCAVHQRRAAARAAFDCQLEARLVIQDDTDGPRAEWWALAEHNRAAQGKRGSGWLGDWLLGGMRGEHTASVAAEPLPDWVASSRLPAPQPIVRGRYSL